MSAEERKVRKLQRRHIEEDQHARDEGLRQLVASFEGRRMLWLLLADCGVFSNRFTGNALTSAFGLGEQNIGQQLLAHVMNVVPDAFLVMQKENADVERTRRSEADRTRNDSDD